MRTFFVLLFFSILIACKEEKPQIKLVEIPKIEITNHGKIILIDSLRINKIKDSAVVSFYENNNYKTFWLADPTKEKLIVWLNNVEEEGLFSKDFELDEINATEKIVSTLSNEALIDYDILLTENIAKFILKSLKGTLNPNILYSNYELKVKEINVKELLLQFQKNDDFDDVVNQFIPQYIVYKSLKSALRIINKMPKDDFKQIDSHLKFELNDSAQVIIDIKKRLMYWKDLKPADSLTPIYDETMLLAVKKFQIRHGLAPDGLIGVGTINALNFSKNERKKQIIANMERWRWYPNKFENEYVIINIPDYTLWVVKQNDTVRQHRVIIGRAARKTPVLSSNINNVIFNPTWTVPPTILNNDVIPAVKSNINYLKAKNITVYDAQNNVVSADEWKLSKAKSYRYVQSPGAYNSLGFVKFTFLNRFSVYLHDTNSRGYFDKEIRALSSGCIRVQDPFELTLFFLEKNENWNLERIDKIIEKGKTVKVDIVKDIFIHVFYWTAWSENGVLQFRDDLYNYDKELYSRLSYN